MDPTGENGSFHGILVDAINRLNDFVSITCFSFFVSVVDVRPEKLKILR